MFLYIYNSSTRNPRGYFHPHVIYIISCSDVEYVAHLKSVTEPQINIPLKSNRSVSRGKPQHGSTTNASVDFRRFPLCSGSVRARAPHLHNTQEVTNTLPVCARSNSQHINQVCLFLELQNNKLTVDLCYIIMLMSHNRHSFEA